MTELFLTLLLMLSLMLFWALVYAAVIWLAGYLIHRCRSKRGTTNEVRLYNNQTGEIPLVEHILDDDD